MRGLLSQAPQQHPFDDEKKNRQTHQVDDHHVEIVEVVERQGRDDRPEDVDVEGHKQGVEADAADEFVLDSLARAGYEQRAGEHADQHDVVADGIQRRIRPRIAGQQERGESVEPSMAIKMPKEGGRDEEGPSDSLERVGSRMILFMVVVVVVADRRRCALLPPAAANVK